MRTFPRFLCTAGTACLVAFAAVAHAAPGVKLAAAPAEFATTLPAGTFDTGTNAAAREGSAFALETVVPAAASPWSDGGPVLAARTKRGGSGVATTEAPAAHTVLTAERAQILLRSLALPGWGQATLGRRTSSTVFLLAEAGVWASFTAFRVQEQMRREAYERTARVLAGIDLNDRDEEFRRIVGSYISSEEYNLLVVARDAANLYYDQPDSMRWYIDLNALRGGDSWSWSDEYALRRYRGQRKDAQRAGLRTSTALGLAVVNRVLSAIHAARASSQLSKPAHSFRFEVVPAPGGDPTAYRLRVRTEF